MKKSLLGLAALLVLGGPAINAQEVAVNEQFKEIRKGQFFFAWGYNRGQYSLSDIHVWGPDYDFTLENVCASDRPSDFEVDVYFNPTKLAIPQYNMKIGYYFSDRFSVSFFVDHMKYVVRQWQSVKMNGTIDPSAAPQFAGNYVDSFMTIRPDFFDFEHTNGLNLLGGEVEWMSELWQHPKRRIRLNSEFGLGASMLLPRTDAVVFGVQGADIFHIAGFGLHSSLGLRMDFGKHFFARVILKGGFISLPDVLTFSEPGYGASHHFWFSQEQISVGYAFHLKKPSFGN